MGGETLYGCPFTGFERRCRELSCPLFMVWEPEEDDGVKEGMCAFALIAENNNGYRLVYPQWVRIHEMPEEGS